MRLDERYGSLPPTSDKLRCFSIAGKQKVIGPTPGLSRFTDQFSKIIQPVAKSLYCRLEVLINCKSFTEMNHANAG